MGKIYKGGFCIMARPKKLSDDEMLKIVDSFYESNGNPSLLKCSLLEEYAVSLGVEVKAYDFRRNEAVRHRMDELCNSVDAKNITVITYKSIDVDAILNRNYTREMLRNTLLELDEAWRQVYENAAKLSEKNKSLLADTFSKKQNIDVLTSENDALSAEIRLLKASSSKMLLENRYLKKALKQYLYPAVANEILKKENVLEHVDTEVTTKAMDTLSDSSIPSTFSNSVAADREMISRDEALLSRMRIQVKEDSDG